MSNTIHCLTYGGAIYFNVLIAFFRWLGSSTSSTKSSNGRLSRINVWLRFVVGLSYMVANQLVISSFGYFISFFQVLILEMRAIFGRDMPSSRSTHQEN